MIGIINSDMFGASSEPGEHVDWSTPDVFTPAEAEFLLGDVASYAASNAHMIVFEVSS